MFAAVGKFIGQFKLYIYAAVIAAVVTGWAVDRHNQYEKGYSDAAQKQTDAIVAYQKIVIQKEQERTDALAKLSTEHAQQIAAIQSAKPIEVERTRVIVKTIDRPAVCNIQPVELRDFNEAVNSANSVGTAGGEVRSSGPDEVSSPTAGSTGPPGWNDVGRSVQGMGEGNTT